MKTSSLIILSGSAPIGHLYGQASANIINKNQKQFPLRAGYTRTSGRLQGIGTLDKEGLELRTDPFAHGQPFVGLSRVYSKKNISILTTPNRILPDGSAEVKNVECQEVWIKYKQIC